MTKRHFYQISAIIIVILIAGLLFWFGKGHTLILDNQNITVDGKAYEATAAMNVTLDGQPSVALRAGFRKKAAEQVAGPWHVIKIEILDQDKKVTTTLAKKFAVGLGDVFLVSLPALSGDSPNWLQAFRAVQEAAPKEEPMPTPGVAPGP